MTIKDYLESAKVIEEIAQKHFGKYVDFYELERYDSGNIEFSILSHKKAELLNLLPDDTTNFPVSMQFCYCNGAWRECMSQIITNVGAYKKKLAERSEA